MNKLTTSKSQCCSSPTGSPSKKHAQFVSEKLGSSDFAFAQIIHHGFPYRPTCMAHDPKLGLLIVGTELGYLRIYGKEYVDLCFRDDDRPAPVLFVAFSHNRGGQAKQSIHVLSICEPNIISLWELNGSHPRRINSRRFTKERFSCAHLSHSGNLLLFGSEAGNVYILDASTLALSSQIIHWNRAVGPSFCNHPGPVVILNTSPIDLQRVFIGYSPISDKSGKSQSFGLIIKWNLRRSTCEHVTRMQSGITSMCWHFEGKSFVCGHVDGTLSMWNAKSLDRPIKIDRPHGPISPNATTQPNSIKHVQVACTKSGEIRTIFSGGIHVDTSDKSRYLTIVRKRSTNVFQMDSPIVSMCLLFNFDIAVEPVAVAILLEEDIRLFDLRSDDSVFLDSPHSTQLGRQTITFIDYIAAPPSSLYYNLLKLHNYQNENTSSSESPSSLPNFPLTGGTPGQTIFPYNEIVITGHSNGSLCFWDCSAFDLSPMYSISAERYLYPNSGCHYTRSNSKSSNCSLPETVDNENMPSPNMDTGENSESLDLLACPLAVESVRLISTEPEYLVIVGAGGYVSILKCNMQKSEPSEEMFEISVLEIPLAADSEKSSDSTFNNSPTSRKPHRPLVKVRVACRRLMGFHPQLVCLLPVVNPRNLPEINDVAFNQQHGLLFMLIGTRLFLVDTVMETIVSSFNVNTLRMQSDALVCSAKLHHTPSLIDRKAMSEFSCDQTSNACQAQDTGISARDRGPADTEESHEDAVEQENTTGNVEETARHRTPECSPPPVHEHVDVGVDLKNVPEYVGHADLRSGSEGDGNNVQERTKKTTLAPDVNCVRRSSRNLISEKLKGSSLLRKLSEHSVKIMQHVEKAAQNEKPSKEVDLDCPDDQGISLFLSCCPSSDDNETPDSSPFTVWIATASSRVFTLNCSVMPNENRTVKLTRNGDQIRMSGQVLLMRMISIDSVSNTAFVIDEGHKRPATGHQTFMVYVSTTCIKVCCLPDRCCIFEQVLPFPIQAGWISRLNEALFVCTADMDAPILRVYGLPRLTSLFQVGLPLTPKEFSCPLRRRLICGDHGIVCCLLNPMEIAKMTISSTIVEHISEMHASALSPSRSKSQEGESHRSSRGKSENPVRSSGYSLMRMFAPGDTFNEKSLFDSVNKKEPSGVVEQEPSEHSNLSSAQSQAASSQWEASQMIQAGIERGQKLQQLDVTTARMAESAREFSHRAKQLSELHKQRSERWWQLWR